jgi:hypothetical protein
VAWGLTGDQHSHWFGAAIYCLMALAWRYFESFASVKNKVVMFYFHGQFSFQHEEKLARVDVEVAGFAGAGRHELFDDAELGSLDEVPAVAVGTLRASPLVMLGRFCADDLCRQSSFT